EVCHSINHRTYFISDKNDLKRSWFKDVKSVGVCGATSTPMWLMEEVASEIRSY
ncbi:MAG: 4-hydroxy-3-methylbut-2-enyl diphosphate reductase, partial [Bacteroidetes bacterium]|nr:4-hydroxy-3-methylbut-2-enyl diphosphate reductase [Bacteroidota bacterium]